MDYEKLMKRCIELAKQGQGKVSPNPMVGCVICDYDGKILSEGWHEKYGENHAERNALLKISPEIAKGATLIVNLEPCSHQGKTPPCADLIIEYGIKTVVIGMKDVNPIVAGRGIQKLKDAGVEVIEDVLREDCEKLNEVFIKNHTKHQTFIAIKTATTLDGKIATTNGSSKWITSEFAREKVKRMRYSYDALMTSSSTVLADNPTMSHRCNIILDRNLKIPLDYKIYQNNRVIVFFDEKLADDETITKQTNQDVILNLVQDLSPLNSAEILKEKPLRESIDRFRTKFGMTQSVDDCVDIATKNHDNAPTQLRHPELGSGSIPVKRCNNIEFIPTPVIEDKLDLDFIFKKLYKMNIMSVLVESGGHLNGSMLKYANKIYHFIAPKILGDNKGLSCFDFREVEDINNSDNFIFEDFQMISPDILLVYSKLFA